MGDKNKSKHSSIVELKEIEAVKNNGFTAALNKKNEPIIHHVPREMLPPKVKDLSNDEIQKHLFTFIVKDASMAPRFQEGYLLVMEHINDPALLNKGDVVIVPAPNNNGIAVKRIAKINRNITLHSDNPDKNEYPDIEVKKAGTPIARIVSFIGIFLK